MSIWFVSDGEWPNYFESPIAIGLVGIAGVAFYLILFQLGMLLLSTLVCVFSPKMKRGILGEHEFLKKFDRFRAQLKAKGSPSSRGSGGNSK